MPLIGSANSFQAYILKEKWMCQECQLYFNKGEKILASIDKSGRVRKKVCSDECRLAFDDRFWQDTAVYNNR